MVSRCLFVFQLHTREKWLNEALVVKVSGDKSKMHACYIPLTNRVRGPYIYLIRWFYI